MSAESGLLIRATWAMYRRTAVNASHGLARNWPLALGSIVLFVVYRFAQALFAPLGMGGALLAGLLGTALLSLYYSWIFEVVRKNHLRREDYLGFDFSIFNSLLGVGFILWIARYIVESLLTGMPGNWGLMSLFIDLAIVFVFNAIPEVVYLHRFQSLHALSHAASFTRENWIEWYIPYLILMLPWVISKPAVIALLLAQTYPLLPVSIAFTAAQVIFSGAGALIAQILGIILANWFVVFRGFLFQELESGTRRRRVFEAKQRS